jgi:hypothetical protein
MIADKDPVIADSSIIESPFLPVSVFVGTIILLPGTIFG